MGCSKFPKEAKSYLELSALRRRIPCILQTIKVRKVNETGNPIRYPVPLILN